MREKIRELTKDTAIYGISTIVGRFLGFLLVPFYTHFISRGDMGIYTNIYAYLAFLNIFYIYGMDAAFMKYSSLAAPEEKKQTFSTAYLTVVLSTLLLTRGALAAAPALRPPDGGPGPLSPGWSITSSSSCSSTPWR